MASPITSNITRFLRIAILLWLAYLLIITLVSILVMQGQAPFPWFTFTQCLLALIVLLLASWSPAEQRLGRAFIPAIIILMSVVAVFLNHLVLFAGPVVILSFAEGVSLRLLPLLIITAILVGSQYSLQGVLLFAAGITLLDNALAILFKQLPGVFLPAQRLWAFPSNTLVPGAGPILFSLLVSGSVEFLILLGVGAMVSVLVARLRAQQATLQQANAQLANYASTLEDLAISRERNRVARELHDTLAHTLSSITVQLETIKAYWDIDPRAARPLLDQALASSRLGVQETRRALKELRATPIEDLGLALAIRQLAESAAERGHLGLHLTLPEALPPLTPQVEQCVYRVAQEAIDNVVHHANAHQLTVQLTSTDRHLALRVSDDGLGFDDANGSKPGHFGLAGMQERAALVGGALVIHSMPNQGTTIQLAV